MKIQLQGKERTLQLALPTGLIFSRFSLELLLKSVKINGCGLDGLPPEAADRLAREINRLRKKHGSWVLVEVEKANAEHIRVSL